jgi:hypothetical protein
MKRTHVVCWACPRHDRGGFGDADDDVSILQTPERTFGHALTVGGRGKTTRQDRYRKGLDGRLQVIN